MKEGKKQRKEKLNHSVLFLVQVISIKRDSIIFVMAKRLSQSFFQVCKHILNTSSFQCYDVDITCISVMFLIFIH